MHRIDHPTAAPGNLFTEGNPATATPSTTVTDDWLNDVQENVCAVIEAAGLALEKGTGTQLRDAIQAMLIAGQKAVVINGATFEASVSNGEVVRWDAGNNRFDEAIADGTANNRAVGIADVTNGKVYLYGECPLFSGLTPGARYYLSGATAGAITSTAPTDAVMVGIAKSATTLWVDIDVSMATSVKQIQPITASVSGNALTLTLNPTTLDFRSSPLGSGTVNTRTVASPISVVVPSAATLGTISAVQNRLAVIAIYNAGTVELAVVNIAGGNNLDETTLISTTTISGAATSASVIYSTTGCSNVPFRVVGYVESTQATAGTWATAPSTIQGYGGQALAAMSSLGYGQTAQNVTGSRAVTTTYYNTTGKPIFVSLQTTSNAVSAYFTVNGIAQAGMTAGASGTSFISAIVPPGAAYFYAGPSFVVWSELR